MITATGSVTSDICAFVRAWCRLNDTGCPCRDYLAYDMIGRKAYDHYRRMMENEFGKRDGNICGCIAPIILSRMQFLEERVARFAGDNDRIQYVIMGAGADTFAYRSSDPSIEIYEVDHPDTQRVKIRRIKEHGWKIPKNVHYVAVDFEKDSVSEKLVSAGFDSTGKSIFSIMGVSYYLSLSVMRETLEQVSHLASPGSVVVLDYLRKSARFPDRVTELMDFTESLGEIMKGGYTKCEICGTLRELGFEIDCHLDEKLIQKKYFSGRASEFCAFDNVCLLSAVCRNLQADAV